MIVAGGTPIRAAKNATTTVPIVMAMSPDPVGSGYVESLARPGRNIEGLSSMARELSGKRLELFRDVVPKIRRIGVLWSASSEPAFNETVSAAHALNLNMEPFQIHDPNEFEGPFTSMARDKPDGLFTIASAFLSANRKRILDFAARSRIPGMYHNEDFIEAGGLMSYAPSLLDLYRRAATYVDKILRGAKPAELPVEQPTEFDFLINLRTAKQIGLTIPPNVLARADRVIK